MSWKLSCRYESAFPPDSRADSGAWSRTDARTARKASGRPLVGDAHYGQRHLQSDLRHRERPPRGCGPGVREEDPEYAAPGNRPGDGASKGGERTMSRIRVDDLHKKW